MFRRETPPETSRRTIVARSPARTRGGRLCYRLEEPAPEKKRKIEASRLRLTAREAALFFAALPWGLRWQRDRRVQFRPARPQAWYKKRSSWMRHTNA